MRRTRWSGTVLLAIFLWLFGATASFAQSDADGCYPIPDDGCVAADDGEVDDGQDDDGDGEVDDGDVAADDGETDDGDVAADDGDADDGEVLADDGEADDVEVLGVSLARTGSDLIGLLVVGAVVLVGGLTLVRRARGGNAGGG